MAEEQVNLDINEIEFVQGENGITEAHVKADESLMEDRRNEIAEQIFVEADIALKVFQKNFDAPHIFHMMEFVHANVAMIIDLHDIGHQLYNMDIDTFEIPDSKYTTETGETISLISELNDNDKLGFICNLLHNAGLGLVELQKSGYFECLEKHKGVFVAPNMTINLICTKIDEIILYTNTILNKLYKK